MKIGVIVPTYNERENINRLTIMLLGLPIGADVIIVDDNSPDGTGELADELKEKYEGRVHVIHRKGKLGLGTAYIAGFEYALAQGAERIVTMDADFSHHPKYIPALVQLGYQYHVTIGSRYVPGGGVQNWEWYRRFLSWGANFVARQSLGLIANDCTAGFRCYHRSVLEAIDLHGIRSNGYSFLVEMLYHCQSIGCTVGETPIIFANREHGSSKISQNEIFKAMFTVARLGIDRLKSSSKIVPQIPPLSIP